MFFQKFSSFNFSSYKTCKVHQQSRVQNTTVKNWKSQTAVNFANTLPQNSEKFWFACVRFLLLIRFPFCSRQPLFFNFHSFCYASRNIFNHTLHVSSTISSAIIVISRLHWKTVIFSLSSISCDWIAAMENCTHVQQRQGDVKAPAGDWTWYRRGYYGLASRYCNNFPATNISYSLWIIFRVKFTICLFVIVWKIIIGTFYWTVLSSSWIVLEITMSHGKNLNFVWNNQM